MDLDTKELAIVGVVLVVIALCIAIGSTVQAGTNQREQTKRVEICLASDATIADCAVLIGEKK